MHWTHLGPGNESGNTHRVVESVRIEARAHPVWFHAHACVCMSMCAAPAARCALNVYAKCNAHLPKGREPREGAKPGKEAARGREAARLHEKIGGGDDGGGTGVPENRRHKVLKLET